MFSLSRLAKVGYLLAFSLVIVLLVSSGPSPAQNFGVSGGFRATPGLPVIAYPVLNVNTSGVGGNVGGGAFGAGGNAGGANVSGSASVSIQTFDLGSLFPNHGQIIGLPPPTFMPPLNNFGNILLFGGLGGSIPNIFSLDSDSTGAPWALITAFGLGGGVGIGGGVGGGGGGIGGGIAGGAGGFNAGQGGFGGGGIGGFAGKGMGGFNGKKAL